MTKQEIENIVSADSIADVALPGKLSSIVRKEVNAEIESKLGEYSPSDIVETLCKREEFCNKLANHPEILDWSVRKLVSAALGSSAKSGLEVFLASFSVKNGQNQITLFLEGGLSIKVKDGKHVPLRYATPAHFYDIWERLDNDATLARKQAAELFSSLTLLTIAMKSKNATNLMGLASETGHIELSF